MTKKPRILHVLNYSLPYISGYCSRSHYILQSQKQIGMEVAAVTSSRQQEIISTTSDEDEIEGITYFRTSSGVRLPGRKSPIMRSRLFIRELEKRIRSVCADFHPTVIHAHSPSLCGIPARNTASAFGLPFVYEVRAIWEDAAVDQQAMSKWSWKYHMSRHIETRLLRRSDAVVILCNALKEEIAKRTKQPDKIYVVPNGVDHNKFHFLPKNKELARKLGVQNNTVIGFIGTFFRFEGLDDLAKAWDQIAEAEPNCRLLLVGYGELTDELEQMQKASRHGDTILLPGRVSHDNILEYYSVMDIMVYPRKSIRLTELVTPLKPLEAMAMGKAVIASDVGGLKEIVDGGRAGLLFRAGDISDLAEKIINLIRDPTRREELAGHASSYVLRERSWKTIVERYAEIYRKLSIKRR